MLEKLLKTIAFWISAIVFIIVLSGLFILPIFIYFSKDLPDYHQLTEYDPPTISRIYSSQGDLMSELAIERRIFKSIDEIPALVKNAFIAAEDQNYYDHPGIDIYSISRAAIQNIMNAATHKNPVGGSTITQQVVKNFLLTNERTISRKIKEAILAYRINKIYSKNRILELYLNQIYLGNGAYGVTSAAMNYFSKDLKDLTIEEAATLAALPKAPSTLDPSRHKNRAKARRNWVIERMKDEGYITTEEAKKATVKEIVLTTKYVSAILDNGYYNESVRLELINKYGSDYVYKEGITAHTYIDKKLQKLADDALRQGLINYDRRHGFRGPLSNVKFKADEWKKILKGYEKPVNAGAWDLAIVLRTSNESAGIGLADGNKAVINLGQLSWARKNLPNQYVGAKVTSVEVVLKVGDVILVALNAAGEYALEQIPNVNGALVVMQPKTGKVLALSGGFSFKDSKYNRATQALRQPGSAFKPLVYLAALEKGYSTTSIVHDEPISISQGPGLPAWTPRNYEHTYMGPITLRKALEKSRNLATVRLLLNIGLTPVINVATRLNVYKNPPRHYAMALGSHETTLLNLTNAFTTFASSGLKIQPKLISHIFDRKGNLIFNADGMECNNCSSNAGNYAKLDPEQLPLLSYKGIYDVDPIINYKMLSMLEGVIERGTGQRAKQLGRHLAGKTGTSNESKDTWFIGFSPDLVCGVFVGFDAPKSLGEKEQGASVALPIFIDFMKGALVDIDNNGFEAPAGLKFIGVDINTGQKAEIFGGNSVVMEPVNEEEAEKMLNNEEQEILEDDIESQTGNLEEEAVY